ncbi:flagellin [Halogranum rubrum]|uniref:Flagellin n=1 Tax=Halogranum salarium B-1 TaxID=1210908 RepID=J3JGN7_9EURY|nr:flagellin [Halogranum salarium]EJN60294.1 flagellin [Halogranum salarium B-1]
MASVSVSHMILFIASLIVAASVAGTMTSGVDRLNGALNDESFDVSEQVRTDIEIISDAGSPVYDRAGNENITLLVKNTGTRNLPPDGVGLDVLVDGQYQTVVQIEPLESDGRWDTNDVVQVHIDAGTLSSGDHRVKLILSGDEEVFVFSI